MPTIQIDAKANRQDGSLLFLELDYQGRKVEMTAYRGMTLVEMAQLAVDQSFPPTPDSVFDGQIEIAFHTETITDEFGVDHTIRVVDSAVKV